MSTYDSDVKEYKNFQAGAMKPATTRGIVVSNVDPLFAGRVKVYIPTLHGPTPYGEGVLPEFDEDVQLLSTSLAGKVISSSSFKDPLTKEGLPWATVLSHNMGPVQDLDSNITYSAGIFSIPSPGTEVILMFENNDPKLPIVVGSIIHANEFRHSLSNQLEYLPGITLTTSIQPENLKSGSEVINGSTNNAGESYTTQVSQIYNIRTKEGSTLFISDAPLSKSIVLEGSVGYGAISTLTELDISTLDRIYPAFPTTASAAFSKRTLLSSTGASPLMSPVGFVGGDSISSTGIITVTPTLDVNVPTDSNKEPNNGLITQALYDCSLAPIIEKTGPMPGPCTLTPGPNAKWHAPRSNIRKHIHQGVDIPSPEGKLPLLAPIDCFPLYWAPRRDAGFTLLVLGIDGFAHAFDHLNTIDESIKSIISKGIATRIKKGSAMGRVGIVFKTVSNTGSHLHWETWNAVNVRTSAGIVQSRQNAHSTESTIDPVHDWLTRRKTSFTTSNSSQTTVITGTQEQLSSIYINTTTQYSSENAPDLAKPAGLEISLVPGKEAVTIRHPSGSFIGFDPDGNINIYSSGDINFRANRSITYDVLGVILENAYAKYSRVRTVIKGWARSVNVVSRPKDKADSSMPEFFTRVDNCRSYDMLNALSSTINNSVVIDSSGNEVLPKDLSTASQKPYKINPSSAEYDLTIHNWDSIFKTKYSKYSLAGGTMGENSVYAMMFVESNGDPLWGKSGGSRIGLYGITQNMLVMSGKDSITRLSDYVDNSTTAISGNIEVALEYLLVLQKTLTDALKTGIRGSTITVEQNISKLDFQYLVILAYRLGADQTIQKINQINIEDPTNPKITYLQVEDICIKHQVNSNTLSYVPTVDKLSKLVKPE